MQKYFLKSFLIITTISFLIISSHGLDSNEVYCKPATIRSVTDFNLLQNCTVVTGPVRIVEVDFTKKDLRELKFSNVEEISGYLLVYRVTGLDSLERLFPNLMLIRGTELFDQHALVVVENQDLQDIGLVGLLRVLKGSIRIENNPSLCFTNTIDWALILGLENKEYLIEIKNNKSPNQCPLCYTHSDDFETKIANRHKRCWSYGKPQRNILDYVGDGACSSNNCLNSCSGQNCKRCFNYVSPRGCEDVCMPPMYKLAYKRQCVTNCKELGLVLLGMECVEKCPKHYEQVTTKAENACALSCAEDVVINSLEDLEGLAECTIIKGSLTIEIHEPKIPIVQHLEHAFSNLQEIDGYLLIQNSPQIISLHFFKSLRMIWGLRYLDGRYSVYVTDNKNLQELWPNDVVIVNGCVYFHVNPHLCYDKITSLEKNFKKCKGIRVNDVSEISNGERAVCNTKGITNFNVTVVDVNSNAAVIEIPEGNYEGSVFAGFVNYYREAPFKNVTRVQGRHGCGVDGWFTEVFLNSDRRHIIKSLKPNTQYAFFVQSLLAKEHAYSLLHISDIHYFQTLPAKPGTVAKLYSLALSPTDLQIHWWPPLITNGILDKYILQYEVTSQITDYNATITSDTVDKKMRYVCQCPKLDIESHVASVHVEDYYNKEQMLYMNSIQNTIYVKRVPTKDNPLPTFSPQLEREFLANMTKLFESFAKEEVEKANSIVIPHSSPICNNIDPNVQEQLEKKCVPLERFKDATEIPSDTHFYNLKNLEPGKSYRISLRACVKGLANGCGGEKVIFAQTYHIL